MSSLNKNSEGVLGILTNTVLSTLFFQLDKYQNFIDEIQKALKGKEAFVNAEFSIDDPLELKKSLNKALESKKEILAIINKYFPDDNPENFEGEIDPLFRISAFNDDLEDWLKKFPERNVEFQSRERFTALESDKFYVKQTKRLKNFFYLISILPGKGRNLVLKIFKKQTRPIHYWRHTIPEKRINGWYYKYRTVEKLLPLCENSDQKILTSLRSILNNEEILDQKVLANFLPLDDQGNMKKKAEEKANEKEGIPNDENKNLVQDSDGAENLVVVEPVQKISQEGKKISEINLDSSGIKIDLSKQARSILKEVEEQLANSRDLAGTFELPAFRFAKSRLYKKEEHVKQKYRSSTKNWNNAHRAELIDWRLDLELYSAIYQILILIIDLKTQMNDKVKFLDPYLREIVDFQKQIKKKTSQKFKDRKELRKLIIESKYETRKSLKNKKVKELSEIVVNQNFSGLLDKLEVSVDSIIDLLPAKSWVVNNQKVGPVNESEINLISPSDLIFFESFGLLQKSIQKGKLELLKKSGALQISIESISDLVEFSLDSALDVTDNETKKEQEAVDLLLESLSRSITKVEDIQDRVSEMEESFSDLIDSAAIEFNANLYSLTINENIYEIRFRYTKAKAKATTTEITGKALEKVNEGLDFVKGRIMLAVGLAHKAFSGIKKLYTRNIAKTSITSEVSNFLAESENSIQQLPYVYQRLFKSEPVSDQGMFVGRAEELKTLENAYKKWDQAKYAATVILGEKGSGLTSFINHFIGSLKRTYPVLRINTEKRIFNQKDFLTIMGSLLESSFNSTEEVIEHLNGLTTKRIFILEDLQKFYLRKVDGFSCISQIKRIITSTNDNIFWIVNTTIYTWDYLDKAIRIGDYFEYKIKLHDMAAEQITEIISRRNKISGYYFEFEIPEDEVGSSKLKKLTEEEIQELYGSRYFSSLNKFTNSNIAISLLYWQLSVKEVTEDTIKIMYFRQPDLSFIHSFDKNYLFALQSIVLHDGLTPSELAMAINSTEDVCHLLLLSLFEDGILMKRNGIFILNPLIYRQTVNLLKSQNLLF